MIPFPSTTRGSSKPTTEGDALIVSPRSEISPLGTVITARSFGLSVAARTCSSLRPSKVTAILGAASENGIFCSARSVTSPAAAPATKVNEGAAPAGRSSDSFTVTARSIVPFGGIAATASSIRHAIAMSSVLENPSSASSTKPSRSLSTPSVVGGTISKPSGNRSVIRRSCTASLLRFRTAKGSRYESPAMAVSTGAAPDSGAGVPTSNTNGASIDCPTAGITHIKISAKAAGKRIIPRP